jgi:ankyrin repeat protein
MSEALPAHPRLDWLRKTAKQQLAALRARQPDAKLADAQRVIARRFGFSSWRALKAEVDRLPPSPAVAAPGDEQVAAVLKAAGSGDLATLRALLAAMPRLVDAVGPHPYWGGRPQALHVAIETRRRDVFDALLAAGADIDGSNDQYEHWSPMMLAIHSGQSEMQQELLARGAKIGLCEALLLGDDARVGVLLARGPSALPARGPSAGALFALARTPFALDRLLELGLPVDAKDRWGATPIEAMSRLGARGQPLVRHLIARGIKAQPQEYARLGDRASLATLIDAEPAWLAVGDVLVAAVDFGHHDVVQWLLDRGADANARSSVGSRGTALHSAAWQGDLRMARLLVAAGADTDARDVEHDNTAAGWARVAMQVTNNPACAAVAEYLEGLPPPG